MDEEVVVHIHNGLLAIKKKCIWVSSNEVDEPRAYYTEWSKSEREKQILSIDTYICNLERWYWWIFMLISPSYSHQGPLGSARITGLVKWLGICLLPVGWREWTYTLQEPFWFNLVGRCDTRLFKWSIHLCFRQQFHTLTFNLECWRFKIKIFWSH